MSINSLAFAILSSVNEDRSTGYDLTKSLPVHYYWRASHQQIYREANKLTDKGFLSFVVESNEGKPDGKRYSVTKKGKVYFDQLCKELAFKEGIFRNESTIMLAAGCKNYFKSSIAPLNEAISELQRKIDATDDRMATAMLELEKDMLISQRTFSLKSHELLGIEHANAH